MSEGRNLRPYQVDCVDAIGRTFETFGAAVIVLPTGTGKTVVMAKVTKNWEGGNVLLLAHRTELILQAQEKLGTELGYLPAVEQAERGVDMESLWQGGMVVVGSVQSMRSDGRLEKYRRFPFHLILVDECHHATSASYRKVVEFFREINPALKVLGVTATPKRADNAALGTIFDTVAYQMSILDAMNDGWLVPIRQEFVGIEQVDFSSVGVKKDKDSGEEDLDREALEAVMLEEESLHALANPIMDRAAGRQTLVFTAGVAHAHQLAYVLNRHRPGSAVAVDGETLKAKRQEAVYDFQTSKVQFLCNYGVFTEGFDCPPCAVIAMGRPTKSLGLYTQMLGRGLRPLDGVVDPYPDAPARRAAIAASAKPSALVLDFVGNSQHKLVSSYDVLGGNYDAHVRELAKTRASTRGGDVIEELKKAKSLMLLEAEQRKREAVRAQVAYQVEEVSPFGDGPRPAAGAVDKKRGGSSDAQIQLLVNLGVQYETAASYSKRQASAVIEKLKDTRCTVRQSNILRKYGEPTDVNFEEASRIIDEIARNGWRRREAVA